MKNIKAIFDMVKYPFVFLWGFRSGVESTKKSNRKLIDKIKKIKK